MNKKEKQSINDALKFKWVLLAAVSVIATGTVFYHYFMPLKWLDAVYFSVITITTVGYGDIHPTNDITKIFTIFYVLIGVGIIAASLNILVRIAAQKRLANQKARINRRK
ncbi:MAG: potassium channel family protein [Candidatus Saccharibacteria bacterium]|jgi:voltage-gated potassium channel|nr:potassium channel family protein [Patescibacteria group bacterium]